MVEVNLDEDSEDVRRGSDELPYDPTVMDWDFFGGLGAAPRLVMNTDRGRIVVQMVPEEAPHTVQTMARLAEEGRFDGTPFHRVIANFVAQGGDVDSGTGRGGPGFQITSEFNTLPYWRGSMGMASAGKDTEGSQFFLAHTRLPHLDGAYTVFGWVVEGMGVVDAITRGDRILTASLERD
jgi:cyclophilin family peptidyl-prolyl cis-trans isomerase